jgi:DNA-binding FadR family transcriptional regulator
MVEISTACAMRAHPTERTRADTSFHLAILRASGSPLLVPLGVLISPRSTICSFTRPGEPRLNKVQRLREHRRNVIKAARAARMMRRLLANTDDVIRRGDTTPEAERLRPH